MSPAAPSGCPPLERFRVGRLPSVYIIEDFISEPEEAQLIENITSSCAKFTQVRGRRLQNWGGVVGKGGTLIPTTMPRWLQHLTDRISQASKIYEDIADVGRNGPNHVLVNEYKLGEGILAHTDGPVYYPAVAILSLASPAIMRFYRQQRTASTSHGRETNGALVLDKNNDRGAAHTTHLEAAVVLNRRSLLVFKDDAYTECMHGIDAVEEEELDDTVENPSAVHPADRSEKGGKVYLRRTGTRISLTVRRVLKVHAALGVFCKR
jgi:alkylated DNA repair protein alkB homolog 6